MEESNTSICKGVTLALQTGKFLRKDIATLMQSKQFSTRANFHTHPPPPPLGTFAMSGNSLNCPDLGRKTDTGT